MLMPWDEVAKMANGSIKKLFVLEFCLSVWGAAEGHFWNITQSTVEKRIVVREMS